MKKRKTKPSPLRKPQSKRSTVIRKHSLRHSRLGFKQKVPARLQTLEFVRNCRHEHHSQPPHHTLIPARRHASSTRKVVSRYWTSFISGRLSLLRRHPSQR